VPRIEVLPEQLHSAGSRQVTLAAELRDLGSRLIGIGASAADGAGDARAGGSMMDCCQSCHAAWEPSPTPSMDTAPI
jgi:cytochrome c2